MRPSIAHQPFGPCRTSGTSRTMGFALAGGTPADRHEYLWRRTDGIPYARARTAAHPSRGRVNVSGRPQDRDPVGQGRQTERDPHAGWPPPLPRVGGPGAATGRYPVAATGRLSLAFNNCRLRPTVRRESSRGPFVCPSASWIL